MLTTFSWHGFLTYLLGLMFELGLNRALLREKCQQDVLCFNVQLFVGEIYLRGGCGVTHVTILLVLKGLILLRFT